MNNIEIFGVPYLKKGSGIHIKKKNRGKFTEYCEGEVTDECILRAKKSKNPKLRKRATFAANARKWKHKEGGELERESKKKLIKGETGFVNKRPIPGLLGNSIPKKKQKAEEGAKIHKPNGHRSVLDNGWIPTKRLKKGVKIFGLVPKGSGGTFDGFWGDSLSFHENANDELRYFKSPDKITGFSLDQYNRISNARKYLILKGLSDVLISALFGNIMKESSFNPNAVLQGGDNAQGLFLMHGDRLKDYLKWRNSQSELSEFPEIDYFLNVINTKNDIYTNGYNRSKQNVLDAETRLNEAKLNNSLVGLRTKEYNNALSYHNSVYGDREKNNTLYLVDDFYNAWNNPESTVEDLTHLFERTFERAGRPDTDKRVGYANLFYDHFSI